MMCVPKYPQQAAAVPLDDLLQSLQDPERDFPSVLLISGVSGMGSSLLARTRGASLCVFVCMCVCVDRSSQFSL